MIKGIIHKTLIIEYIWLFFIFNIGLPFVVYYCEMMHTITSHETCTDCHSEPAKDFEAFAKSQFPSCCSKQMGVEHNKTQFIPQNEIFKAFTKFVLLDSHNLSDNPFSRQHNFLISYFSKSPHEEVHLFIYNSSLLI